jgi:hypothetical protein
MWDTLNQLLSSPNREIILSIATIVSSSILVFTLVYNIKSYSKMRMTDQIKLAQDFFKDYREFKKQSEEFDKSDTPTAQRKDWAEEYFNSLEWFAYLVNTEQIKNQRLISMFEVIIRDAWEKIRPKYFTEAEKKEDDFYPELNELYDNLNNGKIKIYHHKRKKVN